MQILDVFEHEPPTSSPLLDHDKVIVTPHLGASTVEAQEKVAISVANEMIDILENGNVTNAVNAPKLNLNNIDEVTQQWIEVGELSGELAIQLLEEVPREIKITFNGEVSEKDTDLIIRSIVTRILQQDLGERVNLINAMALLKEQGVTHHIENRASQGTFSNYIQIHLTGEKEEVKIEQLWFQVLAHVLYVLTIIQLTLNLTLINSFHTMQINLVWSD